jgi:hypothetical protein
LLAKKPSPKFEIGAKLKKKMNGYEGIAVLPARDKFTDGEAWRMRQRERKSEKKRHPLGMEEQKATERGEDV